MQVTAIPFLATDVGGVAELLAPADRERLLTEPTPKAIANKLADALQHGLKPAHPTQAVQHATTEAWVVWHHITLHRMQVCSGRSQHALAPKCSQFVRPPPAGERYTAQSTGHTPHIQAPMYSLIAIRWLSAFIILNQINGSVTCCGASARGILTLPSAACCNLAQAFGIDATMQLQRHPLVTVCIVHFNNPALLKQVTPCSTCLTLRIMMQ